jgi:hypothetical protein
MSQLVVVGLVLLAFVLGVQLGSRTTARRYQRRLELLRRVRRSDESA